MKKNQKNPHASKHVLLIRRAKGYINTFWLFLRGKDRREGQKKLIASACSATLTDIHLHIYNSQVSFLVCVTFSCTNPAFLHEWKAKGATTADWPSRELLSLKSDLLHTDRNVHIQFHKPQNSLCMQQLERAKCSIWIHQSLKAKLQANPEPGKP